MRRATGAAAFVMPLLVLAFGPWLVLGLLALRTGAPRPAAAPWDPMGAVAARDLIQHDRPARLTSARGRCGCRTIVVDASNFVRDAEVRSGDASVKNYNVTYVSSELARRKRAKVKVEVDQRARALTGDAIAGQLISVANRTPGCANILVKANNVVEDSEVRSGDAEAENRNYVLMDPGVKKRDVKIEVDQHAHARSGQAIAGQIIGVLGTSSGGCRGRVDVQASNQVTDTEVRSGVASELNKNVIQWCREAGCADELRALLATVSTVEMCKVDGCEQVDARVLADALRPSKKQRGARKRASPSPVRTGEPLASPSPSADASPGPDDAAAAEPSPAPTPTPAPAPAGV